MTTLFILRWQLGRLLRAICVLPLLPTASTSVILIISFISDIVVYLLKFVLWMSLINFGFQGKMFSLSAKTVVAQANTAKMWCSFPLVWDLAHNMASVTLNQA